jgi:hypothetical protein
MRKPITLMTLGSALVAMVSPVEASAPRLDSSQEPAAAPEQYRDFRSANTFYTVGENLLGLTAVRQADGTVLAQHASHASHSSHSSHSSHYSSV